MMTGAFCEQYGESIRNQVIEYFLENDGTDISVGQMAMELKISRPKAYKEIKELKKKSYVIKSRKVGTAQLYSLNKNNSRVELLAKNFMDCLQLVAKKHSKKSKSELIEEQNLLLKELIEKVENLRKQRAQL